MFVYWVLFEVCAGWTGSKEDVQVWNILFFSLEKLRGAPAQRFEFVQNRNRRTGARPVARGSGACGNGRATEKRQKIRKKIFEG